jgi:hypothetical protein
VSAPPSLRELSARRLSARVAELERRVAALEAELQALVEQRRSA